MMDDREPVPTGSHEAPAGGTLSCVLADGCQRIGKQALRYLAEEGSEEGTAVPADLAGRMEALAGICTDTACKLTGASQASLVLEPDSAKSIRFGEAGEKLGEAGEPLGEAGAPVSVPLQRDGRTIGVLTVANPASRVPRDGVAALAALGDVFCDAWLALRRQQAQMQEQRQALDALASLETYRANRTQFLGVLSHELRNPATALIMGLSLLDIVDPDSAQGLRAREIMRNQTMLLVHLLDELQDVTRLERQTLTLQSEPVDLSHVAQGAILEIQEAFSEQDVLLVAQLPEKPIRMNGDPARLADMLRHLLDNALKASRAGGSVWLRMEPDRERQSVVIEVLDEGRGISPGDLPLLFQPFAMADRQFDRIRNGLGIGLAIVQGVVTLHGGQVEAFSEGLGKGARFVVRLPLLPEAPPKAGQ